MNIFPDIRPRDLRIAEVKSWHCDWMDREFPVPEPATPKKSAARTPGATETPLESKPVAPAGHASSVGGLRSPPSVRKNSDTMAKAVDNAIADAMQELSYETKEAYPTTSHVEDTVFTPRTEAMTPRGAPIMSPLPAPLGKASGSSRRPQLRLKLEDMPTPQQAEERAQRAAHRLIAKREAIAIAAAAASAVGTTTSGEGPSATQEAHMKLSLRSYNSSDGESDAQSPTGTMLYSCLYNDLH
jgi:hypothetical protein